MIVATSMAGRSGLRAMPLRRSFLKMAAVSVIGGTRSFGRHHGGPQRRLRRAFPAERRAIVRLLQPLQDLAADADAAIPGFRSPSTSKSRSASWSRYSSRSL